jgi:hypothetical protein
MSVPRKSVLREVLVLARIGNEDLELVIPNRAPVAIRPN